MRMHNALILFDTSNGSAGPRDRLDQLGIALSSELHAAMLVDAAHRFAVCAIASIHVQIADATLHSAVATAAPLVNIELQSGATPAERIISAFEDAFNAGYKHVMLVFTDAANVPQRAIETGFLLLDTFDDALVIGATDTQGAYAIGLRRPCPALLETIARGVDGSIAMAFAEISIDDAAVYTLTPWHTLGTADKMLRFYEETAANDSGLYPALRECIARNADALRASSE